MTLILDPSKTFSPAISSVTPNAISSPVSGDGAALSDLPDGLTVNAFGRHLSLVNPSQSPTSLMVEEKGSTIPAICCQSSSISFESLNLTLSLASKLQKRLQKDGSIYSSPLLKFKSTPLDRLYCQLDCSEQTTNESGYFGWPTPAARDGRDISRSNAFVSQRRRHSPSLATVFLERGGLWTMITNLYCLAMGYPLSWNEARLKGMEMQSSRKLQRNSSRRGDLCER